MSTPLQTVLQQFREDKRSNRDLGDRFERMMVRYFELDPIYADRFEKVWMWSEWPDRGNVGDVGIDLVARERATGEYCAIQCKFYLPEHTLSKADLDSFFTAMGRDPFTSGMIISTTDKWGRNAEDALNQTKPVTRLSIHDLEQSPIDWSRFSLRRPQDLTTQPKKKLRPHQTAALEDVVKGLQEADRGKLIMACGTGKTFTSLKIAEAMAPAGRVLFLVPSLSLLAQTLREWTAEAENGLHSLAVCSDTSIGKSRKKRDDDDKAEITLHDLASPATTKPEQLIANFNAIQASAKKRNQPARMTAVFSTYQSIEVVSQAQKAGLPEFDMIICDEAHRTTGVTLTGEDESHFVKVHDQKFIRGRKRLYMTATPRIFGDDAKSKAKEAAAELASMDDPNLFGHELHRLGFGEAVAKSLLTDYKVLVLAVDEKYVATTFQSQIADKNNELNLDDATKITGCWNGLEKRFEAANARVDLQGDSQPMRRAVAFSRSIKDSRAFVEKFHQIVAAYQEAHPDRTDLLDIEAEHVDGTFDALRRGHLLQWLKDDVPGSTCRILSNARCLSEGVDVPALDAVLFLNPRNSVVDVVQSVGRVMRRAEGKRYGYIILPIGIPADQSPEEALKNNEKYKVVWQVLQALRAHDDRFNATINQLELNRNRPDNIQVIGVGGPDDRPDASTTRNGKPKVKEIQGSFAFPELEAWKDAIYARMVLKCGDRAYWQSWAQDIIKIADRHISRIKALVQDDQAPHAQSFADFVKGLQSNLNDAVTADDAIEMLAQHMITKPVFDALFAHYAFTEKNPVSQSMQRMLDILHEHALEKETATLERFYASVRDRASGIDNAEGRQRVVNELYEEFFKTAFPRTADRLGIVYTPLEVVDFIVHSVEDVLREEFNSGLGEKDVHIIDPFTGTGTFIVRLLQSGLIPPDKLAYKYRNELHANEIVLLAYYIAAINIEETYHGLRSEQKGKPAEYEPFDGIVLTDTFQLYESGGDLADFTFPENNKRVRRQKKSPIRVIIANPPYSAKQESANDDNQNLHYPSLDGRIQSTYAASTSATNKTGLYDSYIRAIRWAGDRIDQRGVIGFVTNGSFIDGNAADGLRACLTDEFASLYVFNCRGNARTQGEVRRMESGNVFGGGTRTPVAITILVKNPDRSGPCTLHYHDIGDYLTREQKLGIIKNFRSLAGVRNAGKWQQITPNAENDWINQRDEAFGSFIALGDKSSSHELVFSDYSGGVKTNRDVWCYNFSTDRLSENLHKFMNFYNTQREKFAKLEKYADRYQQISAVRKFVDTDKERIAWSDGLLLDLVRQKEHLYSVSAVRSAQYRPYCHQMLYYGPSLNERVYQIPRIFPTNNTPNIVICTSGIGAAKEFSSSASFLIPDLQLISNGQCFPLYLYEKAEDDGKLGFDEGEVIDGYRRKDAITDWALSEFRTAYGPDLTKEDIFYYIYGILHSEEYRRRFAADLKKMLPRIPLTKKTEDFWAFSKAGRDLAHWHLNYETIDPYPLEEVATKLPLDPFEQFKVQKMNFARPTPEQKAAGEKWDKSQIIYNSHITLRGIPPEAYDYVVNGKPALEWILERYQVTVDKASGIRNDPNDWCKEHNQPRYIIDLIGRIVRVSLETMKIVRSLPALNERR